MVKQDEAVAELIKKAYEDTNVPKIYANGFVSGMGTGDMFLVLQRNNVPVACINLSFTMAKTVSGKLKELVTFLENKSTNRIMTADEIEVAIKEGGN